MDATPSACLTPSNLSVMAGNKMVFVFPRSLPVGTVYQTKILKNDSFLQNYHVLNQNHELCKGKIRKYCKNELCGFICLDIFHPILFEILNYN